MEGVLPRLAAARKLNRGFEALALSADGKELILAFQSPLAHPDRAAHKHSGIVRIWALDARDGVFLREYAYPLGPPESFLRDCAAGPVERGDVKISEIASLPGGGLLVLERVTLSTHVHRIRLDPEAALPSEWLDPSRRPTLEQMTRAGLEAAGVPLLEKTLVLSTDDHPEVCGDLEGMILLDAQTLLLVNDSDYGTEGADTQFWKVDFPEAI